MISYLQALLKLTIGVFKVPPFWAVFIQLLVVLHGVVPLFFLPTTTAIVVLFCFYAGVLTMGWLTMRFGFTRILWAAHIWWIPMFLYLITQRNAIDVSPLGIWLSAMLIIQPITLALDVWDISRWISGDRAEMVSNLP